ncbi:MAG: glutamate-5-semialdehyde dehydrogenase [Clostridiales bacterium]|jgi:glutamate-5-semialdehyde dehydrogenase|nr:glutamate-5-semialdehyde dehydrogenase [Clostridiales bacterium]
MSEALERIGQAAKNAAALAAKLTADAKNRVLNECAKALESNSGHILEENNLDLESAEGIKESFRDRLRLTAGRVKSMADGLRQVASLPDPTGEAVSMKTLPNGLTVIQKRVPMGVIAIIYEARPNVTADAFGLCFKAGSGVILRGGKEAIRSNTAIAQVFRGVLDANGLDPDIVQIITDTSRETAQELMRMNKYVDLLIPRGGAGLIQSVVNNSSIPVIETGVGNCHIFVDESADFNKAVPIIINAKTQRPGVCNAAEKLLIHENIAVEFLPVIVAALREKGVELRGDKRAVSLIPDIIPASEEDWRTEYADLIIAVKIVSDMDEAMAHIREYSSNHSEAVLTENYTNAQRFLNEVDSAAVYVNASTRFTDGGEFGFGAEIGISTQKLHARGPMGLKELTSTKYIIYGNGQIRK